MKQISLLNKHALILTALALCMNLLFLCLHNPHIYFAITQAHGQIGYHLYHCNKIGIDATLTNIVNNQMHKQQKLIDYDTVSCDATHEHGSFPINDTIGYGILLGLLWKVTGSLRFFDVQILQIILFSILMPYYYQLAYLLFSSTSIAFLCGIAHLLFFPLLAYNVMPVRDIWAYYGLLVLAYTATTCYYRQTSPLTVLASALFFSICLWMRPTLALALILFTLFAFCTFNHKKALTYNVAFWITSGLLFWVPSMHYNYSNYGRYFVSPAGQSLLEGLGEIPNPWGHKLNDEYVNAFIGSKYQLIYGTPEFDDAAMYEFISCVKQNPWHYCKTLLYRLPDILLPGLQWIFYTQSPYAGCTTVWQKLRIICSSLEHLIVFFARHIWMRLYLICSYIGLYILLRHKQYTSLWLILICLCSGLSTYPSHIEYRYIVPFYWILSLPLGYICYHGMQHFTFFTKRKLLCKNSSHCMYY